MMDAVRRTSEESSEDEHGFSDEYFHEDIDTIYTPKNLASGEACESFSEMAVGCTCEKSCDPLSCACLKIFGPAYDHQGRLLTIVTGVERSAPIVECGDMCCCDPESCHNRVVALGPAKRLKVIDAGSKGLGLTTEVKIEKGKFVCEYAGEVITAEEANARLLRKKAETHPKNYIFLVNEVTSNSSGTTEIRTIIDAEKFGNIGRYVNHSCEPNLEKHIVRTTDLVPHLCFFAMRDISHGEELTVSYAGMTSREVDQKLLSTVPPCLCGASSCAGHRPFQPEFL